MNNSDLSLQQQLRIETIKREVQNYSKEKLIDALIEVIELHERTKNVFARVIQGDMTSDRTLANLAIKKRKDDNNQS
jgi:hypothetical protein